MYDNFGSKFHVVDAVMVVAIVMSAKRSVKIPWGNYEFPTLLSR